MSVKYPLLGSQITLGSTTLKNRIVFSAHLTNFARNGCPTDQHLSYYRARARGGTGLIITEELSVHPSDWPYEKLVHAYNDEVRSGFETITREVHNYGAKIFAQINHNGSQGSSSYSKYALLAPSEIPDPLFRENPIAIDESEIRDICIAYGVVAKLAQDSGFDGIELQCSHSSLVRQFLSPLTNRRVDRYGGDLIARSTLLFDILNEIRYRVGSIFTIGIRLCGDEMLAGGINIKDTLELVRLADASMLVDYINTSIGVATASLYAIEASMAITPGYNLYIPSQIRAVTDLPVIASGRIKDPAQAERILRDGQADLVGIVRGQIADPDFAAKSLSDHEDTIRVCLSCNQECVGRMGLNRWLGCIENPNTGREFLKSPRSRPLYSSQRGLYSPTSRQQGTNFKKWQLKVLVIGAGPAGLQAAVSFAETGHKVKVFEEKSTTGGLVSLAANIPTRAELGDLVRNLNREIAAAGIVVTLNTHLDVKDVEAIGADVIVVATGSRPSLPYFLSNFNLTVEGDKLGVCDVVTVLEEGAHPQGKVLVLDDLGFHQGTSVAELLAHRGCTVTIATPQLYVGQDLGVTLDLETWNLRASALSIEQLPETIVTAVDGKTTSLMEHTTGKCYQRYFDWIILANHRVPNDHLAQELLSAGFPRSNVRVIGDALAPRRIHQAIIEAQRLPEEVR